MLKTFMSDNKFISTPEQTTANASARPKIIELTNLLPGSLVRYRLNIKY